ncbi:unnamed protein product [Prunus brigantina]
MSSPKIRASGSSSSVPPDYITGAGVDDHAIEVRSKLYPFAKKNLDENVLHLFENTLVLGPHWFGSVPTEMAEDENLLAAALCFWNSASNTFDFRVGPMAPTLLDMAQIFGFRPHGRPVDAVAVLLEYRHLAEALHNHTDVGLGPTVLAHLFKNLYSATLENPLNLSAPGAFWMIQIWLQVYFPELRFPDVVLPEDQVLAQPLMAAEVPKRSIEEYLMFFRHCTKRSAAQWQVVIRRTYPWFQPRYRLFEKEPEEETARTDFRKRFLSVTLPRDLPYGGGKPPNYHLGAEFDAWWKTRFQGLPASSTALKVLFNGWDSWAVHAGEETHQFMVQIIKDINAQIIEDPSLTKNIGGQTVQAGEVIVTSVISAGDLELPSVEEEDETLAEPTTVEGTSARRKRKETAPPQDSMVQLEPTAESPPPPTRSKRLRKRTVVEYVATEDTSAVPTATSGTDDELREAFEEVEKDKVLEELERVGDGSQEKSKTVEEEEEIPAEVIAESIALAQKQQEETKAELTSSELALFENPEAEQSTTSPATEEQAEQPASEPVEQAELPILVPEAVVNIATAAPEVVVEVPRSASVLAVVTSPLKPPIVAMPIHSLPGSSATASFADPELAEFEAMDLDAQLDKLEKLSSPPSKAKSRAVEEAMERLKIWQSSELELDEDREAFDQLMKDLDLLHRQNTAPRPILEMSLGLARDVLNLYDRYEDLKPSFKTSEFCKVTHEANLADFAKQKAELDQMVAGYKEAKATADKLEKQIDELQKQLAKCREVRNGLGAGLSSKTKATFLVRAWLRLLGQPRRLQRLQSTGGCYFKRNFPLRRQVCRKLSRN